MTSTPPSPLDTDIVASALSALQELSMLEDESSRKASAYIAALLWEYRDENLPGLRDHLILALSRCGFSPTSTMLDKNFDRALLQYDGIGSFFG